MRWRKASGVGRADLQAFIDEGSEIEGRYTFRGTVLLNGKLSGEIHTTDTLVVGDKGQVRATIRAGVVVVSGEVTGTIVATERIELRGRARVSGDLEAPVVVMEEGVLFEGHCTMTRPAPAAVEPAGAGRDEPRDTVIPLKR